MATLGRGRQDVGSSDDYFMVTPSDTVDLSVVPRFLSVGTSGAVSVVDLNGRTVALWLYAGIIYPMRVTRVNATGTNAANILAQV